MKWEAEVKRWEPYVVQQLREAMHASRTIYGVCVREPSHFFEAIDTDRSGSWAKKSITRTSLVFDARVDNTSGHMTMCGTPGA
jgi:hypothetical protein